MLVKTVLRFGKAVGTRHAARASSYSMFLKSMSGDSRLTGLDVVARGRVLGKVWRALPDAKKQAFAAQAKGILFAARPRVARKRSTAYATFTKANLHHVAHLPGRQRFAAIAKLWKAQKGKQSK